MYLQEAEALSQEEIEKLNEEFETASPQAILRWAVRTFGQKLAVVTSFQPTGIVTLHMLSNIDFGSRIDILTLDTGLLFPETYDLMDALEQFFNLNLIRVKAAQTVSEQNAAYGNALWTQNPDMCCNLRKVIPLDNAMEPYEAWVTGLRRDQSSRRANTPVISWDKKHKKIKLCPFATWTEKMVWSYIKACGLPYNPLHDYHYPSIGCLPCTQPVMPDATDLRAGRWSNRDKTECGIHVGNL